MKETPRQHDPEGLQHRLQEVESLRHDLNNLLMGLMGHAELLVDSQPEGSEVHRKATRIQEEAQRIKKAIAELKRITRGEQD